MQDYQNYAIPDLTIRNQKNNSVLEINNNATENGKMINKASHKRSQSTNQNINPNYNQHFIIDQ